MDVAVLYKNHLMTTSLLHPHGVSKRKRKQQRPRHGESMKEASRKSSPSKPLDQCLPLRFQEDNINIIGKRTSTLPGTRRDLEWDDNQKKSGYKSRRRSSQSHSKLKKTLGTALIDTTNTDNKKTRKGKGKSVSVKVATVAVPKPNSDGIHKTSSTRNPSSSLSSPGLDKKARKQPKHKRGSSWKSFFSSMAFCGSRRNTNTTYDDRPSSAFVPAPCKSIAKCFDTSNENEVAKTGNVEDREEVWDDVLMPAEVLELPTPKSSSSSSTYSSKFVIPSSQSSALFSHQETILAKISKEKENFYGSSSSGGKDGKDHDNAKNDIWVERFYMNRQYQPVTYYRSVTNPDRCVLHEPPTGVNASNIILLEDLQAAMRLLVMGKNQQEHEQHYEREARLPKFQQTRQRSTSPRLSEYIEKTKSEDSRDRSCSYHHSVTTSSYHPYPRIIDASLASSVSCSSKASLLNSDYNKKVATAATIRKLMLDPLDGKLQDVLLTSEIVGGTRRNGKRGQLKDDGSFPVSAASDSRPSRTVTGTASALGTPSKRPTSSRRRLRRKSHRSRELRRFGPWQVLAGAPRDCKSSRDRPPRRAHRHGSINGKHRNKTNKKRRRSNSKYCPLSNCDGDLPTKRRHHLRLSEKNNALDFKLQAVPESTSTIRDIPIRESLTTAGRNEKRSNSLVVPGEYRSLIEKLERTMSLQLNTMVPASTASRSVSTSAKPDPPQVMTDTNNIHRSSIRSENWDDNYNNQQQSGSSIGSVSSVSTCSSSLVYQGSLEDE